MNYICPVCGFDALREAPYGAGMYEICPSCGFQFGVTDDDRHISFEEWREDWIARGMPWSSKGRPEPQGWNPKDQLRKLQSSGLHNLANKSLKVSAPDERVND